MLELRALSEHTPIDSFYERWTARRPVGCNLVEYRILWALANELQPRRILEIGPGCGASTMAFCLGSQALETLLQVTIHPEQCYEVVEDEFRPKIETIIQQSDEFFQWCTRSFDLIFIDGDHTEAVVERDIKSALDRVAPGGIIICHDIEQTCIGYIGALCQKAALAAGKRYDALQTGGHGLGLIT